MTSNRIRGCSHSSGVLGLLAFAAAAALALPTTGMASVASLTGSGNNKTLVVTADPGEQNEINIFRNGNDDFDAIGPYWIEDSDSDDDDLTRQVRPGAGCKVQLDDDDEYVTCPAAGVAHVQVDLGDRDDLLTFDGDGDLGPDVDAFVQAGTGNDLVDLFSMTGSAFALGTFDGPAEIHGGTGNDELIGGFGADRIFGEEGTDIVSGGWERYSFEADDPVISGGSGVDVADLSHLKTTVSISLDDVANDNEGDGTAGDNYSSDIEWVLAGEGNDTITSPPTKTVANLFIGGNGDDTLRGGSGDDSLNGGLGNDLLFGDAHNDTMNGEAGADGFFGSSGTDTVTYAGRPNGVTVTIGDGANDGNGSDANQDNVDSQVENLIGGNGADTLTGNGSTNTIRGGNGGDTIDGGEGSDTLAGEGGTNTLSYASRTVNIVADLNQSTSGRPGLEDDSISNFANVTGGDGDDQLVGKATTPSILTGGDGNDELSAGDADLDYLYGGPDDDTLNGGEGSDRLLGGDGVDEADYSSRESAVTVTTSVGGGTLLEEFDLFLDIESATGGDGNDYLQGDGGANELRGGNGNDRFFAGGGADTMRGGHGNDTFVASAGYDGDDIIVGNNDTDVADYSARSASITIDLDTDNTGGQDGENDHFLSTESLVGGSGDDELTANGTTLDPASARGGAGDDDLRGGSATEYLYGGDGNDVLTGGPGSDHLFGEAGSDTLNGDDIVGPGGNDRLNGGAGDDQLRGGLGRDVADYSNYGASNPITANLADGQITAFAERDSTASVEDIEGSAGNDRLTGNSSFNELNGNGGNDTLDGGTGQDDLRGGDGTDSVTYQDRSAAVTVTVGDGWLDDGEQDERDNVYGDVENVFGGSGDDSLSGNSLDNLLYGGPGVDLLYGNEGNDVLLNSLDVANAGAGGALGGPGEDVLIGGNQQDWLIDNDGQNDTFMCFGDGDGDVAVADFLPLDPIGADGKCEHVARFAPAQ